MRTMLLAAVLASLTACATMPAPLTAEQISGMETAMLCEEVGRAWSRNDAQQFHLISTELRGRNAIDEHCIDLAQIGLAAEDERAARRAVFSAAFREGMRNIAEGYQRQAEIYQRSLSERVTCTSTRVSANTVRTDCR